MACIYTRFAKHRQSCYMLTACRATICLTAARIAQFQRCGGARQEISTSVTLGLCEWWVYDLEWSSSSMFKHLQSNSYRYHVPCSTRLDATTCYLQICSGPAHMDSLVLSLCWSLAPGKDERLQSWKRMKWKSRLYFCRWNYHDTQDCDMTSLLCQEDTKLWHDSLLCRLPVSSLQPGRSENGVPTNGIAEDEDLLNVALWQRGSKWSTRSTPHK